MKRQNTLKSLFIFSCLAVPSVMLAGQDTEIVLHVHGIHPLVPIQTTTGDELLVFQEEPIEVSIIATRLISSDDAELKVPGRPLTEDVQVRFRSRAEVGTDSVSSVAVLDRKRLNQKAPKSTASGLLFEEEAAAWIPRVAPGRYEFWAIVGNVSSNRVLVTVASGSESIEIERQYLRHKAEAMPTSSEFRFDEYKALMLKLAGLEPENAMILDELGDTSLNHASLDETLKFYGRSEEIIIAQRKTAVPKAVRVVEQLLDRKLAKYVEFRRVLADLRRKRSDEDVVVLKLEGRERFALVDRASRAVVRMF